MNNLFDFAKKLPRISSKIDEIIDDIKTYTHYDSFFFRRVNYEKFMNAYSKDLQFIKYDSSEGIVRTIFQRCALIDIYSLSDSHIEMLVTSKLASFIEEIGLLVDDELEPEEVINEEPHILMLISNYRNELYLNEFNLKNNEIDVNTHYNDDLLQTHEKIIKKIQDEKSAGLILLHGEPGTGKTVYIKHLTSLLPKKEFVFFPREYIKTIASPNFLEFAISNLRNTILVVEDAEELLLDRTEFQNNIVPAILNITDGMLSDLLNIKMICTFNCKEEHIDSALLRKGRLIAKYKFDKLCYEKAKVLADAQNKQIPEGKPITLAEIYGD